MKTHLTPRELFIPTVTLSHCHTITAVVLAELGELGLTGVTNQAGKPRAKWNAWGNWPKK